MPTNDDPAPAAEPRARRSLGRGPGTRPTAEPPAAGSPPTEPAEPPREAAAPPPADTGPAPAYAGAERATEPLRSGPDASPADPPGPADAGGAADDLPTTPGAARRAMGRPGDHPGDRPSGRRADAEREAEAEGEAGETAAGGAGGTGTEAGDAVAAGSGEGPRAADAADADSAGGAETGAGHARDARDAGGAGGGVERPVDDGRFTVRLANFEGPFDLLLQLISKHKLDVTEVALSKVTDEFMAHIRAMGPDWDLDQTTEFLVVAATLLDLKAARLLPSAEVEDEADLALLEARDLLFARLLQYRAYKRIADIFQERLDAEARRYPRTVGLEPHHADLLPDVVIRIGAEGFAKLAVKAMQPRAKPQVYVDHIHAPLVSVREQAEVVVARLRELGVADFQTLTADAPDTLTVVARFLALLELYRERAVALDQEEALGVLRIRWTGTEGERPQVTDEFDQEAAPDPDAARHAGGAAEQGGAADRGSGEAGPQSEREAHR
ncbi:segregation/condensation protein A [Streptomyces sp. HSW2009]|uniref:segregation and condensation protein A n=1 Tax=Streptomyces sp. HSW2009 TaxID=3142890 RepID=UPI0032EBC169